jgi:DNA-directed RNA polymerase sigma subunit (sigma70/sigma32)
MTDDVVERFNGLPPEQQESILRDLKTLERQVLARRFGWDGQEARNRRQVARSLNLDQPKVDGTLSSGLDKIRRALGMSTSAEVTEE